MMNLKPDQNENRSVQISGGYMVIARLSLSLSLSPLIVIFRGTEEHQSVEIRRGGGRRVQSSSVHRSERFAIG